MSFSIQSSYNSADIDPSESETEPEIIIGSTTDKDSKQDSKQDSIQDSKKDSKKDSGNYSIKRSDKIHIDLQ